MTTSRLTELLEETSSGVAAPSLAAAAWNRSRTVRRRRRLAVSVAAFVAVAAVVVPLNSGTTTARLPGVTLPPPLPVESAAPSVVDRMPASLPQRKITELPPGFAVPAGARGLSAHPVDRAVAVVQEHGSSPAGAAMRPLHVLDAAGNWTRIDVGDLVRTHDAGGNQADPLRAASLSPDRRRVAVPQPQALVVVDLTTGRAHRIAVPGRNEQVMWWGDAIVLVGAGGAGVVRVDWAAGTVTPEPAAISAWNSAGSPVAGGEVPELLTSDGRRAVRVWEMGSPAPVRELPVGGSLSRDHSIDRWYGPAVHDGAGRVAATAWGARRTPGGGPADRTGTEFLTVVSTATGAVQRALDLGDGRSKGCCTVLDWIDAGTVLVHTDREGLITWDVRTGAVARVTTGPVAATVSIRLR